MSELSRATHEACDDSEEAEVAHAELYEFIRVSAQLVFETLARAAGDK